MALVTANLLLKGQQ